MGKVRAGIVIDEAGNVTSVNLISGHPMLAPSAIAAIKKWRYKPFEIDGKSAVIRTEVEVSMPEHISDNDLASERKFQDTLGIGKNMGISYFRGSPSRRKGELRSSSCHELLRRCSDCSRRRSFARCPIPMSKSCALCRRVVGRSGQEDH
jgi:TonB family protein